MYQRLSDLGALFDEHVRDEFVLHDAGATMTTMTEEPYVYHVPTMTGGNGRDAVFGFYRDHFVGKWPADTTIERISRTVGVDQVVDELIVSFTHDVVMDAVLPGVAPTGKRVSLPTVVVVKCVDGKVAHEHIYWDQASALVQAGLLERGTFPLTGGEQAQAIRDRTFATNALIPGG
jgi:carboxymethylenebutenolidase